MAKDERIDTSIDPGIGRIEWFLNKIAGGEDYYDDVELVKSTVSSQAEEINRLKNTIEEMLADIDLQKPIH